MPGMTQGQGFQREETKSMLEMTVHPFQLMSQDTGSQPPGDMTLLGLNSIGIKSDFLPYSRKPQPHLRNVREPMYRGRGITAISHPLTVH